MADKEFIKENIVGRKGSWRKRFRYYLRLIFSALLFGILGAASFAVTEPRISALLQKKLPEEVVFTTEPAEESSPEETLPSEGNQGSEGEETAAQTEEAESTEAVTTEAVESIVQRELKEQSFTAEDYEKLIGSLRSVTATAERSIVEVRSAVKSTTFLGDEIESGNVYPGIAIARTSEEILFLTPKEAVSEGGELRITIDRSASFTGTVKGIDTIDGIAVVAVPQEELTERQRKALTPVTLGNNGLLTKGDLLIAVGAPAGVLFSSVHGQIASITYRTPGIDGSRENLLTDIHVDDTYGSFLINTEGELVGWVFPKSEEAPEGYSRISAVSDFIDRIELLSNGMRCPYLGLVTQEVTLEMQSHGLPTGLYIRECRDQSPSYEAGVQSGDILVKLGETEIRTMADLRRELKKLTPGEEVEAVCLRQRGTEYTEMRFQMTVGER